MGIFAYCGTAHLDVGDRVRHRVHRALTGTVKELVWARPARLSALPYRIEWDDTVAAHALLGAPAILGDLWIHASDETVEQEPEDPVNLEYSVEVEVKEGEPAPEPEQIALAVAQLLAGEDGSPEALALAAERVVVTRI